MHVISEDVRQKDVKSHVLPPGSSNAKTWRIFEVCELVRFWNDSLAVIFCTHHKTATHRAMATFNLTLLSFLGAFSLGLILGNAGHLAKLGVVLKSEFAPCFVESSDGQRHHVVARVTSELSNETVRYDKV